MTFLDKIKALDGQQLTLWAYLRQYGEEKIIHIDNIHKNFPFAKYLFTSDSKNLEEIFSALVRNDLLKDDERLLTYKRVREIDPNSIWSIIYNRLINTDKSFVKNKMYDIIKNIQLYEFLDLERSLSDKNYQDPFLMCFSEDARLGRKNWWKSVYHLANLYDNAEQNKKISDLFFEYINSTGLVLNIKEEEIPNLSQQIDETWRNGNIVELNTNIYDVTPWKKEMAIQILLAQWRDISLDKRDQIKNDALKSLLQNAAIAHLIIPVGNPTERDEDLLKSTQLVIITPEDGKDIFIHDKPKERFKQILRERMDIELLSPYQTTGFVPEAMFFGREYQIRLIVAHPDTNYAIYGSRRSGKTSLMKQLLRLYCESQPAFLNGELVSGEEGFYILLSNALNIKTTRSSSDFEEMIKKIQPGTLLFVDEIDHALKTCDPNCILGILRHLCGQYGVRCILAGTTELYKQYRDRESPMYNFADPLPLGPFTELEAIELAREPMLSLGVLYEKGDGTVKQLVNLCGRFPNLIQLMCHELVKEVKRQGTGKTITSRMIKNVFEGNTFGDEVYQQFHHNFNPYQKLIVYASLMVKEMPLKSIADRVQIFYPLSLARIEELLDELVLLFVFEKIGSTYKWIYEGFPTILRNQIKDVTYMINQTVMEIQGETEDK